MITKIEKEHVVLGIDTTTNICSVALWDGKDYYEEVIETARAHSKSLLPMVDNVFKKANLKVQQLQGIACTRGPGSFTGVRIGIGVAKGIAFGCDIPIYPISPLQAIAYQTMQKEQAEKVIAMMDARMSELYVAEYNNSNDIPMLYGQERLTNIETLEITNQSVAGTGVSEYREKLEQKKAQLSSVVYPYAIDVIKLAQLQQIQGVSAEEFTPVYLRNKVTY
ncbi:MAG: tRNA (adenosine(37)-N6)-threonylcarbamoyltransferase complex dimerization subunit type 1 TsaB [Gammaproteobacteria bacterium]|nr:tRNA (adenosine(37)-N6)-threonylcarbamoyltransferase complex dimerization subunit type 1 TsaB [Gammaproteobacteria bacterium]